MNIPLPNQQTDSGLIDPFGRAVTYLRVSVTDRCDFRCTYCMAENMTFLPRKELLSLEELDRICSCFVGKGVRRLRLTGGEPLVRRNIMWLIKRLSRHLDSGKLEELTLTSNGSQLEKYAKELFSCGVRRVNISLDTLDPAIFKDITRRDHFGKIMRGIDAAQEAGLLIKINMVALKNLNEHEIATMVRWCHERGMDLTLIETMPMGQVDGDRYDNYLPLSTVKEQLRENWTLTPLDYRTGGPSRYYEVEQTGGKLGFITPLSHKFCESCNRVRLTCTGILYMCLGQDDAKDLLTPLRSSGHDLALRAAIDEAISLKPEGHDFHIDRRNQKPAMTRHMSVTGG
ncbi:MAG: GTP 3',8-cyclase MoaA [bacterium]|nr:GTP 3',8-cyclase MoaA [bacterium]